MNFDRSVSKPVFQILQILFQFLTVYLLLLLNYVDEHKMLDFAE